MKAAVVGGGAQGVTPAPGIQNRFFRKECRNPKCIHRNKSVTRV